MCDSRGKCLARFWATTGLPEPVLKVIYKRGTWSCSQPVPIVATATTVPAVVEEETIHAGAEERPKHPK